MIKFLNSILFLSLFATLFAVFYFSWLPSPSFKTEHYLPNWLIKWTDEYGIIRTGIPFILLGINAVLLRIQFLNSTKIFLGLFSLLLMAEFGQLFLPHRHFDMWDMIVGICAILAGIFLGNTSIKTYQILRG